MSRRTIKRAGFLPALALWAITAPALAADPPVEAGRSQVAWPTGDRSSSVLLIERVAPAEVRVGQPLDYEIRLTNLTRANLNEFILTEQLPTGFEVKSIDPKPTETRDGVARWTFGQLNGAETRVIRVSGTAGAVGSIAPCNTITFTAVACQKTIVVEPALKLVKTAPAEVMICDPIPMRLVVTNTGSGSATDVTVEDTLPEGWTTSDGKTSFVARVGTLRAGESREVTLDARSSRTGTFTNNAVATETGGLTARASSQTVVRQPVLEVTKRGSEMAYVGRPVTYEITVTNKGDAPAKNTVLTDTMDAGVTFVSATDGGRSEGGRVIWNLGTLGTGESKSVKVTSNTNAIKTIRDTAVATAECAEARASASTVVKGIPAILLEVEDTDDPVEVGANTTYIIVVTNQGSANDTNVRIKCQVPDEEEFVSADGPTRHTVEGKTVVFEPLPTLEPKAKATYRVVVKGLRPQDVRFAVELTSDNLTRPVNETESTHVY